MKRFIAIAVLACTAAAAHAKDIVQTAVDAGDFKTLATALDKAGLIDTLKGKGPFTVFAPTDAAFAKLPKADLEALLADKAKLTKVLTYHVVPGAVMAKDVKAGKVGTVEGSSFTKRRAMVPGWTCLSATVADPAAAVAVSGSDSALTLPPARSASVSRRASARRRGATGLEARPG